MKGSKGTDFLNVVECLSYCLDESLSLTHYYLFGLQFPIFEKFSLILQCSPMVSPTVPDPAFPVSSSPRKEMKGVA